MVIRSVPLAELPGISRLAADYSSDFGRVGRFYHHSPRESESYAAAAEAIHFPDERRAELVDALAQQNQASPALEALARPGTLVVATGQQTGLFTGPVYTIYKALTAARLAQRLTERGMPAVPVFWMATEDHDLIEVNHCWVFNAAGEPVRIEAAGDGDSQTPVGTIAVQGDVREELRAALAEMPQAGDIVDAAAEAYAPGRTFGEGFRTLLGKLLGPYGMLFLDPLQPAIRRLAAPALASTREKVPGLVPKLIERGRELEAAGYHAQVLVEPSSTLLFRLDGGRRIPLRRSNGDSYTQVRPEDLSPNALLRPVIQDTILPTVATVMGPAEVAYMAQAEVIYRELLGRMPVVVNRASFTLVDARSLKLIKRYGFSLADLSHGEEAVRAAISRKLIPPALARSLNETASAFEARLEALRSELVGFDPTLADAVQRGRRKILHQVSKLDSKVGREALRRDVRTGAEAAHLVASICPHRQLQERFYSILPFLAKHSLELLDQIYQSIDLDSSDHQLLQV